MTSKNYQIVDEQVVELGGRKFKAVLLKMKNMYGKEFYTPRIMKIDQARYPKFEEEKNK